MRSVHVLIAFAASIVASPPVGAQSHDHAPPRQRAGARDTAYHALQDRGARVMGVDQYTSSHRFEALADGGRIELVRDEADTAGVRAIRDHLRTVARQFAAGDFGDPAKVHARPVPGTDVMRVRRRAIRYDFRSLPRGGEIRMTSRDPAAVRAIHAFLAFQRSDHRTQEH